MTRRAYIWTHDIAGNQSGVIGRDFRELYVDTTLDQTETLHFAIPAQHNKAYLLAEDLLLRYNGRQYFIKELTQERNAAETLIRVEASALWYRLGEIEVPGSLVIDDQSPADGLGDILEESGWTVGDASVDTGSFSIESQDQSLLALIRTWAKVTGTYASFDTLAKQVTLSATRGRNIGLAFRKGRNLRNVKRRRTPPKVTQVYPYGRDDLTIAGVNGGLPFLEDLSFYTAQGISEDEARSLYTKRRILRDTSFVKEADLLTWAQGRLATEAQSIQSVELDVVDIAEITGVAEDIETGDNTRAYDPDFDEEFSAIVTGTRIYPLAPARNEVELSTSPPVISDPSQTTNPQRSQEWLLFTAPVSANFRIRNDAIWTVARLPLRFTEGGKAQYHLDLWFEGVGDGTATVTVHDDILDEDVREELTVTYVDGVRSRVHLTWAAEELSGRYDYRIRVTTVADGGADPTRGVDLALEDDGTASFYVLAQGAVQETPTAENSVTFNYTGAVQQWTVPDNVVGPITIEASGAGGGGTYPGSGGSVTATFSPVTPGDVFDVYVGGGTIPSGAVHLAGWPDGGVGGAGGVSSHSGGGGGGSTYITPAGESKAQALVLAPGGGGSSGGEGNYGGDGGLFVGGDGDDGFADGGTGATQFADGVGGAGAGGGMAGSSGSSGMGGAGGAGSGGPLSGGGGGGGGGYRGGGGGGGVGSVHNDGEGGGGGGAGFVRADAFDTSALDGGNSGPGSLTISWPDA